MQSVASSAQTQVYPSGLKGLSRQRVEELQLALTHGFSAAEKKDSYKDSVQSQLDKLFERLCVWFKKTSEVNHTVLSKDGKK